ncbi:MAG: hypothetical protein OXH37_04505, partial [Gammaproteobacteria bacterium]|nr:hypothetical protein [Gammaproteobacteria bacterium]
MQSADGCGNLEAMSPPLKKFAGPAGPILAVLAALFMLQAGFEAPAAITLGVTALCVVWWV